VQYRVLVVEDQQEIRTIVEKYLLKEGYAVVTAKDGFEALEAFSSHAVHLVLLDIMMPGIDGFEVLKEIRHVSEIPVIILTARQSEVDRVRGLETGADDYIPKPFNLKILQAKMTHLIENRRNLKRMFSHPGQFSPSEVTSNPVDEEFLAKAYEVLARNYTHPEFSASQFASEMFVSQSLLYKKIKALTDLSITDFINSYKLKRALDLMKMNDPAISDIAFSVGFNDPKYFSRLFRKFYGMTPTEFSQKR